MFAGIDFKSQFNDNGFGTPHGVAGPNRNNAGVGNRWDPDSLFTEGEIRNIQYLTGSRYAPSSRNWPDEATYLAAVGGHYTVAEVLAIAPRVPLYPKPAVPVSRQQATLGPWGPE